MTARPVLILTLLVVAFGAWLRIPRHKDRVWVGTDEGYYSQYVDDLAAKSWPQVLSEYIADEKKGGETKLPPTRILFLGSALTIHALTGCESIEALRLISWASAIGTLIVCAVFVSRMSGPVTALAVTALLACSPLLIHLAHRALIDGYFAFTALLAVWGLWESLRAPADRRWLALYAAGLAAMVLTKENAAFAFVALLAIIALNRWLKVGTVTRPLLVVTFAAPALAAIVLIITAGGPGPLIEAYRLNATKSVVLPYAIQTGDGPWHRYLLDFLLVSPAVTLLAVAALAGTHWRDPAKRHLAIFILVSFALMAQVRYGMNMRYGAMWVLPLCWLAFNLLASLSEKIAPRFRTAALTAVVFIVCATELHSYHRLFVAGNIYDPVPGALAMPLKMWKPNP